MKTKFLDKYKQYDMTLVGFLLKIIRDTDWLEGPARATINGTKTAHTQRDPSTEKVITEATQVIVPMELRFSRPILLSHCDNTEEISTLLHHNSP